MAAATRASQGADAAVMRAEKDRARSGAPAAVAAENPYTAAEPYPAAGAAVPPPTGLGTAYFSGAPTAVGAPAREMRPTPPLRPGDSGAPSADAT